MTEEISNVVPFPTSDYPIMDEWFTSFLAAFKRKPTLQERAQIFIAFAVGGALAVRHTIALYVEHSHEFDPDFMGRFTHLQDDLAAIATREIVQALETHSDHLFGADVIALLEGERVRIDDYRIEPQKD